MNKKSVKIICAILLALIIAAVLITLYRTFYKTGIVCNDAEKFVNGKYVVYDRGKDAALFLPDYTELKDFDSLEFRVFDGRRKTTFLHKFFTNYTLDIKYENIGAFNEKVSLLKNEYDNYLITSWKMNYDVYMVKNLEIKENHIACFAIDEQNKILRYAIFFVDKEEFKDDISKEVFLSTIIPWNSEADW